MPQSSNTSRAAWVWPGLVLALSCALLYSVYLNLELKNRLVELSRSSSVSRAVRPGPIGREAIPIEAYVGDGSLVTLLKEPDSLPVILAWFSDECDVCYFAGEAWNRLAREYPGRIWALRKTYETTPDSLFFGQPAEFPILLPTDASVFDYYETHGTPQTILVSGDQIIDKVWKGALSPDRLSEVITAMSDRNERR